MRRQDTWRVTLKVDGIDLGVCRTKDGAAVESDMSRVRAGGMAPEEVLGGPATRTNSTVELAHTARLHGLKRWLESRAGNGTFVLSTTPLDKDKNPSGKTDTDTGVVENVTYPEVDADSNDPAVVEIELALNERGA